MYFFTCKYDVWCLVQSFRNSEFKSSHKIMKCNVGNIMIFNILLLLKKISTKHNTDKGDKLLKGYDPFSAVSWTLQIAASVWIKLPLGSSTSMTQIHVHPRDNMLVVLNHCYTLPYGLKRPVGQGWGSTLFWQRLCEVWIYCCCECWRPVLQPVAAGQSGSSCCAW